MAAQNNPSLDPVLIRDTISDLDLTLVQLERQRAEVDARIADVTARRDRWAKQLTHMAGNNTQSDPRPSRTPKGQNRQVIRDFLAARKAAGGEPAASIPEIATSTGIGRSSVRTTLFQNKDVFSEITGGGAWMLK